MSPVLCRQDWRRRGTTACLPAAFLGSTSPLNAYLATQKGKAWSFGFAEAGATESGGDQAEPLPGPPEPLPQAGHLRHERPALGGALEAPRPWALIPFSAAGALFMLCYHDHTRHGWFPGRSACARVTSNMIVQVRRRPSVCARARSVCALCVCFKSPLGGSSFFLPFLFGCDLGEIDSQPVRWMLTVPLIYRVTYAK